MKVLDILRESSWLNNIDILEDEVEVRGYTPAGEDFVLYLSGKTDEELAQSLAENADLFDADEHVELLLPYRGKNGVPSSISVLLEDAQWIKQELNKLAKAL